MTETHEQFMERMRKQHEAEKKKLCERDDDFGRLCELSDRLDKDIEEVLGKL